MPPFLTLPWFKPDAIRLFPLPDLGWLPDAVYVHPYGLMVMIGTIVGALVASAHARRHGLEPRILGELAGYVLISGFVFGHLFEAVFYRWDAVAMRPFFLLELWNGLSSFGGFLGAVIGALVWRARRGYSLLVFADSIAFSFPFGWVFGRIGCFFAHDHPGAVSDFVLAVRDYRVERMPPPFPPRHDLGLYEAIYTAALAVLFVVLARFGLRRGAYLALLPMLYAPVRFGLDFLRAVDVPGADPRLFGLTPGHYGAVALFLAGVAVGVRVLRGPEPEIAEEARLEPVPREEAPPPAGGPA